MSFLNPIKENVIVFSSTDNDAPQINYNKRVAGDVKTILKACLVTGYGNKQGAGWTMTAETEYTAEFASPTLSMNYYKLVINDGTTSQTTWQYRYQNTLITPVGSIHNISKYTPNLDTNIAQNGWKLLVTSKAFYFIEIFNKAQPNAIIARMTFFGQVKSALANDEGKNIGYWSVGYYAPNQGAMPSQFFNNATNQHFAIGKYLTPQVHFSFANKTMICNPTLPRNVSYVELINPIYLSAGGDFAGEQVGLLLKTCNDSSAIYGVYQTTFEDRPVLYVCIGSSNMDINSQDRYVTASMIYLDYWEF